MENLNSIGWTNSECSIPVPGNECTAGGMDDSNSIVVKGIVAFETGIGLPFSIYYLIRQHHP